MAGWHLVMVSGSTAEQADAAVCQVASRLRSGRESLSDVCHELAARPWLRHRRFAVCRDGESPAASPDEQGRPVRRGAASRAEPRVVFLCPGVGDEFVGMGHGLYDADPVFAHWIDWGCDRAERELGIDLRKVFLARRESPAASPNDVFRAMFSRAGNTPVPDESIRDIRVSHPAMFVLEHALIQSWSSRGVRPAALLGHSLGELTAACAAGVLDVDDALRLVAGRAHAVSQLPGGVMLAVQLSVDDMQGYLTPQVTVALMNAPAATVVAGARDAIDEVAERLTRDAIACRPLATSHAFHSPMLADAAPALRRIIASIRWRPLRIPYVSNVTGRWATDDELRDPEYWIQHMCRPAAFATAVGTTLETAPDALLEVGPGRSVSSFVQQHTAFARRTGPRVLASLGYGLERRDDEECLLTALGQLWAVGVPIDWSPITRRNHGDDRPVYAGQPVN